MKNTKFHLGVPVPLTRTDLATTSALKRALRATEQSAAAGGEKPATPPFSTRVTPPDKVDAVMALLHRLADRQEQPKEIIMPLRAAMDSGVLDRPTWTQFCAEFPGKVSAKSSYNKYMGDYNGYQSAAFDQTKAMFSALLHGDITPCGAS